MSFKKKLIMIMGMQRSGGSTLMRSFAHDPGVCVYHQKAHPELYYHRQLFLRPVEESGPVIDRHEGVAMLEPKSDTKRRTLLEVMEEYSVYDLSVVWNYRHPVDVFYSRLKRYPEREWMKDVDRFAEIWNNRNAQAVEASKRYPGRVLIVRIEDMFVDPGVYFALCARLGIRGRYKFYRDPDNAARGLNEETRRRLMEMTEAVYSDLKMRRCSIPLRSAAAGRLQGAYLRSADRFLSWIERRTAR